MEDFFKDKTVLFKDSGMFIELAIRLSKDFGRVLYFSDWISEYPISQDDRIGEGVPGLERVSDFWECVYDPEGKYKVDIFVYPSIYNGWEQLYLRSVGKRVWGSGLGDQLERYRMEASKEFKKLDLPRPKMISIIGIDNLKKHLRGLEDKYIKISNYRGNFETKHFENYELSERWFDELSYELGDEKNIIEFIVEDPIVGSEFGYDGFCIDGSFPETTIFGLEIKDCGYCCHVKKYTEISPLITDFNDKVSGLLNKYQYRNFMSTEIRIDDKKTPYMIDFTARIPSPPGELYMEMVDNISEIIWFGSEGVLVEPIFNSEFGIEIMINSESAQSRWLDVSFPDEIRRWVKLRNLTIINDRYCIIPRYRDFQNIGAVIATGKSMDECIKKVNQYAEKIKGEGIDVKMSSINKMNDVIESGKKLGILF